MPVKFSNLLLSPFLCSGYIMTIFHPPKFFLYRWTTVFIISISYIVLPWCLKGLNFRYNILQFTYVGAFISVFASCSDVPSSASLLLLSYVLNSCRKYWDNFGQLGKLHLDECDELCTLLLSSANTGNYGEDCHNVFVIII